ncbi:MAG TPA: hypothetical protein PLV83_04040 [Bacilli bacterium]|nr:hypothetical protein [Bacilli bacterium]
MGQTVIEIMMAITSVIVPVVVSARVKVNKTNKYKLNKISEYDGKLIVNSEYLNGVIKNISSYNSKIIDEEKKILLPFIEEISKSIKEEDLKTMYNNISTVKISKEKVLPIFSFDAGCYYYKENEINYTEKNAIGHEFLHLSSSIYDKDNDIILLGFEQIKDDFSIGTGLNEGYTELLASRFYRNGIIDSYKNEASLASLLEMFFDKKEDMYHLYFNSNLPGLITYLEKYIDREEIIKMIIEIDNISYTTDKLLLGTAYTRFIKLELKLYDYFKKNFKDQKKINEFKKIISKEKIISLLLNNEIKVQKNNRNYKI